MSGEGIVDVSNSPLTLLYTFLPSIKQSPCLMHGRAYLILSDNIVETVNSMMP
jgi:hypothetical protein